MQGNKQKHALFLKVYLYTGNWHIINSPSHMAEAKVKKQGNMARPFSGRDLSYQAKGINLGKLMNNHSYKFSAY